MLTVEQMKSEIESLTKERDALAAEVVRLDAGWHDANGDTLVKALELDNVKAAAKLALEALDEALDEAQKYAYNIGKYLHNVPQAITALRQAGVQ